MTVEKETSMPIPLTQELTSIMGLNGRFLTVRDDWTKGGPNRYEKMGSYVVMNISFVDGGACLWLPLPAAISAHAALGAAIGRAMLHDANIAEEQRKSEERIKHRLQQEASLFGPPPSYDFRTKPAATLKF